MEMRRTGNIWHSPYNVYKHLGRLAKSVGQNAIEKEGKYKCVREARAAAITALIMYKITKKTCIYSTTVIRSSRCVYYATIINKKRATRHFND